MGVDISLFEPYLSFFFKIIILLINVIYVIKTARGAGNVSTTGLIILNVILFATTNAIAFVIPSLDGIIQQDILSLLLKEILSFIF